MSDLRDDIIPRLSQRTGVPEKELSSVIDLYMEELRNVLVVETNKDIYIKGIGWLRSKFCPPKKMYSNLAKREVMTKPKVKLTYYPDEELTEYLTKNIGDLPTDELDVEDYESRLGLD